MDIQTKSKTGLNKFQRAIVRFLIGVDDRTLGRLIHLAERQQRTIRKLKRALKEEDHAIRARNESIDELRTQPRNAEHLEAWLANQ
jgi:transcription elongation factor GreA-like protein